MLADASIAMPTPMRTRTLKSPLGSSTPITRNAHRSITIPKAIHRPLGSTSKTSTMSSLANLIRGSQTRRRTRTPCIEFILRSISSRRRTDIVPVIFLFLCLDVVVSSLCRWFCLRCVRFSGRRHYPYIMLSSNMHISCVIICTIYAAILYTDSTPRNNLAMCCATRDELYLVRTAFAVPCPNSA